MHTIEANGMSWFVKLFWDQIILHSLQIPLLFGQSFRVCVVFLGVTLPVFGVDLN